MGQHTKIQWCDSTVNPTSGCDGCELWNKPAGVRECYAGVIHERFSPSKAYPGPFEAVNVHPGRMEAAARWPDLRGKARPDKPWLNGMPRVVFVGDMGDILSRGVMDSYIFSNVFGAVETAPGDRHVWMLLTKQSGRLADLGEDMAGTRWGWPENLWAGVSVTGRASRSRIDHLRRVPAVIRFVSAEPLRDDPGELDLSGIHLVIAGGASGRDARPCDLAWLRSIRDQCRAAGVAFFLKQLGARPIESESDDDPEWPVPLEYGNSGFVEPVLRDSHGGDWTEWPADLRVREFPRVPAVTGA